MCEKRRFDSYSALNGSRRFDRATNTGWRYEPPWTTRGVFALRLPLCSGFTDDSPA